MKRMNHHRTFAALSLVASTLFVLTPGMARAGNVTATTHVSTDTSSDPGVDDTGSSTDPLADVSTDPTATTTDSATTGTAAATPAAATGIFGKIGEFFTNLTAALTPIMEFLTMINQYTHWFDGILGGGLGSVGGANGPMGGTSGTGTTGTPIGSNPGRNTPTTVPSGNPAGAHGHIGTASTSSPVSANPGHVLSAARVQPVGHVVGTTHAAASNGGNGVDWMFKGKGAGVHR